MGFTMFFEKHSRFVRRFDFRFSARKGSAPVLPLIGSDDEPTIYDALQLYLDAGKAIAVQPNGDVVDLIKIEHLIKQKVLVLLFHRGSPDAADPTYRKKDQSGLSIRTAARQQGEEQAASAHLIIRVDDDGFDTYRAVLEEIPGISMTSIQEIIRLALREYNYTYEDKFGNPAETYCTFKAEGKKSETLSEALKQGRIGSIKLVRPASRTMIDADPDFQPVNETMTVRVKGVVDGKNWVTKLGNFVRRARDMGWEDCNVDLAFDDKRRRTVQLDRKNEAKEVLFIRSDQITVKGELSVCTGEIVKEFADRCIDLLKKDI